jgi:hypothetical protein
MPDLHQIREQIREQIAGLEPPNAPGSDYAYISGFVAGYGEARRDALAIIDAAIGEGQAVNCQSCKMIAGEPDHTCPYAKEINGSDRLCNCCRECQHQCAMDI